MSVQEKMSQSKIWRRSVRNSMHSCFSALTYFKMVCKTVGFTGSLLFDKSKPDGTPRKLLDVSKLTNLGWVPKLALEDGLTMTYQDFLNQQGK